MSDSSSNITFFPFAHIIRDFEPKMQNLHQNTKKYAFTTKEWARFGKKFTFIKNYIIYIDKGK